MKQIKQSILALFCVLTIQPVFAANEPDAKVIAYYNRATRSQVKGRVKHPQFQAYLVKTYGAEAAKQVNPETVADDFLKEAAALGTEKRRVMYKEKKFETFFKKRTDELASAQAAQYLKTHPIAKKK